MIQRKSSNITYSGTVVSIQWLAFGTGKSFRYFAAHEIAALPMFHAITGYDNVSCFAGYEKKTAWAVWTVLPELTYALLKLSFALSTIPEDVQPCIERFAIFIYDRTRTSNDIDKTRKKCL